MTQNVHLPPLCVQCLFSSFSLFFLLLSALSLKCAHTSLSASGSSPFSFFLTHEHEGGGTTHKHTSSLGTTGNYLGRMEQVRGVQIALWADCLGLKDVNWRGCHFYVHLIHCSPWWIAGDGVTVFTFTCWNVGVFVCLCQRGWFSTHCRTLTVHKLPVNGNTSLAIILNPPWERHEVCRKPVATCHNPQNSREGRKKNTCLSKLFSLSNCSPHITRITGLILLYNHCSLFPLIVSLLNLFVCVHTLTTQMFFCHANQAICVQGNWI